MVTGCGEGRNLTSYLSFKREPSVLAPVSFDFKDWAVGTFHKMHKSTMKASLLSNLCWEIVSIVDIIILIFSPLG